jgi:general secretion pathway protein L
MADQLRAVTQMPGAFMQWWLGELGGLLPRVVAPSRGKQRPSLVLSFRADEIILMEQAKRGAMRELGRVDVGGKDKLGLDVAERPAGLAALSERRYRKWPLVIRLAPHLGMRKLVELPLAAKDDLAQVLQFELDRLTPFKPEDVNLAWRVQDTDSKAGRMRVLLEIAPKAMIDRATDVAARYQREVDHIELEQTEDNDQPLDLRPKLAEDKPASGWGTRILRITTLVLLVITLVLPIIKQQQVIADLDTQVLTARQGAEVSLQLRERLTSMSNEAAFLANARNGRPTMTELLAELTELLPDHSHILQLRVTEQNVDLMGLADKATDLISILAQSPLLEGPAFNSPVTRDSRSDKERFHISVDLAADTF